MPAAEAKAAEQTGASATPAESTGQTGGSSGSSIDDLLGAPTEAELAAHAEAPVQDAEDAETEVEAAEDAEAEEQAEEPAKPAANATIEQRMQALAQKYGMDLNDPAAAKVLRDLALTEERAADKEAHIQSMKAKPESDGLTEYERQLFGNKDAKPAEPKAPGQTGARDTRAAASSGPLFNDIGARWQSPVDALQEELAAFGDGSKPPDLNRLHEVRQADFRRRAGELIQQGHPFRQAFEQMMDAKLREFQQRELSDVLPAVKSSIAESRSASNRNFALAQLTADKTAADDFAELFKTEGGTFEFEGETFPDNPFNRIVADFPEVLNIRVKHDDPNAAERLTTIEQYRAVLKLYRKQKSNGVTPDKAKTLVEAGRAMEKRDNGQERARQAINSGRSAGAGKGSGSDNYIRELTQGGSAEKGMPLRALLK